jgi:hypothetical protein
MRKTPQKRDADMNLLKLFCDVDDFCLQFTPVFNQYLLVSGI